MVLKEKFLSIPLILFNTFALYLVLNKINGIERKVSIEIIPELLSNNLLLIEENGCEHEMIFASPNIWKTKDNLTLIKNQHAVIKFADKQINILIESTMGINLEGDGFDD